MKIEEMQREYSEMFLAYRKAHSANFRNDCRKTRKALKEAISALNATEFVNRNA